MIMMQIVNRKAKTMPTISEMRKKVISNRQIYQVLLRQTKGRDIVDTPFAPELYKVVSKQGNEVTLQSSEGANYRRNFTQVEKYHSELFDNVVPVVDLEPAKNPQPEATQGAEIYSR